MYSLFIDTHDRELIVALYENDDLKDKNEKKSLKNHSDFTMPLIKDILDKNNITVHDLSQVLVVNGPGSFTGVRIGVTIAKTLSYTLNIPIKTITSLEMYAVSKNTDKDKVVIIRDVKGVFGAHFTKENKLVEEMFYKSNQEFDDYINNENIEIIEDIPVNLVAVKKYMNNIESTPAHNANPIYIKVIEALKND